MKAQQGTYNNPVLCWSFLVRSELIVTQNILILTKAIDKRLH